MNSESLGMSGSFAAAPIGSCGKSFEAEAMERRRVKVGTCCS